MKTYLVYKDTDYVDDSPTIIGLFSSVEKAQQKVLSLGGVFLKIEVSRIFDMGVERNAVKYFLPNGIDFLFIVGVDLEE